MDFQPSEDQAALLDALGRLLAQTRGEPVDGQRSFFSRALDAALEESGLLDAAGIDEFGPVAAALVIDAVARLPAVVEVGASALLRPLVCPDWPRPLAVLAGAAGRPARFLCQARTVLFLDGPEARLARLDPGDAVPAAGFFAYPMGRLADPAACLAGATPAGDAGAARRRLRVALAAEIAGALQGALDAVTEHVRTRRQFGRPLGAFQVVQHRLAAAAAKIAAGRLLACRAAGLGGEAEALMALGFLQDAAAGVLYDLHQFMGAMGLTLEHPLYRWSYRVKLLLSELGGAAGQLCGLAAATWGEGGPA